MGRAQVQEGGKGEGKAQPPRGAQGQARMLLLRGRGELGVGASPLAPRVPASAPLLHFVQTSLSLREGWAEEDKNHQAKQCCISIIPSRLGEGAQEETGPLRVQPEPKPGLLASSLVLLLLHLAVSLRTRCCGERGSGVPGRNVSQQPQWNGRDRPDCLPLWLCSVLPNQAGRKC